MDGLIGRTIGLYRILERVGRGGMATVYKAYQPSLDRYVALKVLPAHLTDEPGFAERFRREARAVAKLEHPHILPVHDYGQEGELTYIAMRYVEGGTLKDLLGKPLELPLIVDLIGQIGEALDHAHEHGVVHRDVKPSNVLLDKGKWALLTDFGVARMVEATQELTGTGVGVGTPAYMSPEQGQGQRVDRRSDVYSLGVVLYEMLTGRVPYEAETPLAVVWKHVNEPLPLPRSINPEIPEAVQSKVLKALAKAREDRYQSAGGLAKALWGAAREAESVRAEPGPAEEERTHDVITGKVKSRRGLGRLKRFWWLASAVVVVSVLGLLLRLLLVRISETSGMQPSGLTEISQTSSATTQATTIPLLSPLETEAISPERSGLTGPVLYDDFNDSTYDTTVNTAKWRRELSKPCDVSQLDGAMVFKNEPPENEVVCSLTVNQPMHVPVRGLGVVQARIRVSSDHNGKFINQGIMFLPDLARGQWWAFCGLFAESKGVQAIFDMTEGSETGFVRVLSAEYNRWYTLRMEVDPDSVIFRCFLDDTLLGERIPLRVPELETTLFVRQLHANRTAASFATTYVDEVFVGPFSEEYDDFEDPTYDGTINTSLWLREYASECEVQQKEGELVINNTPASASHVGCDLIIRSPALSPLATLGGFEARVKIASDHKGQVVTQEIFFLTTDLPGGAWWATCGIKADEADVKSFFAVHDYGSGRPPEFGQENPAEYDRWYTIRLQVDPQTTLFSCHIDNVLLGSVVPLDATALREARFERRLEGARVAGAVATTYVDYVRLIPGQSDLQEQVAASPTLVPTANAPRNTPMPGASLDSWEHITFDLDDPVAGELAVRQAIAYGTDRHTLGISWAPPYRPAILNSYIKPDSPYYAGDSNLVLYPYDPAQSRSILEAAGWRDTDGDGIRERAGVELRLTYHTTDTRPERLKLAELLANQMASIGIRIETTAVSLEELTDLLAKGSFQLAQFGWRENPQEFLPTEAFVPGCENSYLHSTCIPTDATDWRGINVSRWRTDQADGLLDQLVTAASFEEQRELLVELQKLFTEELPMLPLFYRPAES